MKRRTPLKPGKPLRRKTKLRAKRRTSEEFARIYGSRERVKWVKGLPCVVDGVRPSENAHVWNEGMGRKGPAHAIVPLCQRCHERYHRIGALALLQAARKAAPWRHGPLLVWDAQMTEGRARGLWREAESWEGAAELVQHIWENRQ